MRTFGVFCLVSNVVSNKSSSFMSAQFEKNLDEEWALPVV